MRVMKGVCNGIKCGVGGQLSTTVYAALQTQACSDLKVTTLHHDTMERPHGIETLFLRLSKEEGWIKQMLINLKLVV